MEFFVKVITIVNKTETRSTRIIILAIPVYDWILGAAAYLAGASVNTKCAAPNSNWCLVSNNCPYLAIQSVVQGNGVWPNPCAWLYGKL